MIKVRDLTKIYRIYNSPSDRVKELFSMRNKKKYNEFYAIDQISFDISKGETIGIIGKNGSGKSTLLKIISGVLNPTHGEVEVNGKVSAILELGAGFNLEYTGIENIYLNGTLQGKTRKEMNEVLNDIIDFADIGNFINQPVKTYSSGMFARLAFAVAINIDPDILIVDEALAVGDMKFQAKCYRKFEELKNRGVTILFVGHDVSSIRKFCDRTIWLHQGKLVQIGDTLSVTSEYMEYMNSEVTDNMMFETVEKLEQNLDETDQTSLTEVINRWGSQPDLIKSVFIINQKGNITNTIKHGEIVRVKILFNLPKDVDLEHVSIAISIKNTMGLDLLVYTTHDDDQISLSNFLESGELMFEFTNFFTEGDFILVAAIEDRSSIQPQYFDYIEGAAYIKSVTDSQLFGIVHTPVRKYLRKLGSDLSE